MMFSRKRLLNDIFVLTDAVPCQGAEVETAEFLAVRTPAAPWAYAAVIPRNPAIDIPRGGSFVVEIDAIVAAGSVGFGCLTADHKTFLDESVQPREDGPITVILRLDSLEPCGWLMVRNADTSGQASRAVLKAVRVLHIEDDPEQELYIFEHIFKTGGTTFHQSYLKGFRPHEHVVLRGMPHDNEEDRRRLRGLADDEKRKLRVVAGHNGGVLRDAFPEARFLTLVREPTARVISGYLHARLHPDSQAITGRYMGQHQTSLGEFVEADLFAARYEPFVSMHNWQARTLLGEDIAAQDLPDEEALKRAIGRRFWLVGYTESLEMFVFLLHYTAGFPLVLFNNRLVRGARDLQWTPQDLAAVRRFNAADEAVYRVVRNEFDRRVAAMWNGALDQDYRWYMDRLQAFRQATADDPNAMRLLRL
jgi:hypothetical protein